MKNEQDVQELFEKGAEILKTKNSGKKNPWILIVAPLLAAVLFVGIFLTVEKKVLSAYEEKAVATAKIEIEAGTQITKENVEELFTVTKMQTDSIIAGAVTDPQSLIGHVTENTIHAKEMISTDDVRNRQMWEAELNHPIEFTFSASSVAASVGGTIRGGDVIDVGITLLGEDGSAHFASVGRNIYVKEVYNDKGIAIPRSDKETVCTMFRVVMEQSEGEALLEKLRTGDEVIVTLPK